jgi:hypothetical protein
MGVIASYAADFRSVFHTERGEARSIARAARNILRKLDEESKYSQAYAQAVATCNIDTVRGELEHHYLKGIKWELKYIKIIGKHVLEENHKFLKDIINKTNELSEKIDREIEKHEMSTATGNNANARQVAQGAAERKRVARSIINKKTNELLTIYEKKMTELIASAAGIENTTFSFKNIVYDDTGIVREIQARAIDVRKDIGRRKSEEKKLAKVAIEPLLESVAVAEKEFDKEFAEYETAIRTQMEDYATLFSMVIIITSRIKHHLEHMITSHEPFDVRDLGKKAPSIDQLTTPVGGRGLGFPKKDAKPLIDEFTQQASDIHKEVEGLISTFRIQLSDAQHKEK